MNLFDRKNYRPLILMWQFVGGWYFIAIGVALMVSYPLGVICLPFWTPGVSLTHINTIFVFIEGVTMIFVGCAALLSLVAVFALFVIMYESARDRFYRISSEFEDN